MKKIIMLLLVSSMVLMTNCEPAESESVKAETVCNCEQRDKVASFIQSSIKNANNMSDEEMEDVISELRKTAIRIYCPQKNVRAIRSNQSGSIVRLLDNSLDSCEQIMNPYH